MWVQSLGQEDPLEERMATHASIFAWRISWTEEPGRLQSRVAKNWTRLKRPTTAQPSPAQHYVKTANHYS